jgi:hypothetical protein
MGRNEKMTRAHKAGLIWILLCGGIFTLWGGYLEATSYAGMGDFKAVYYGAKCLMEHRDPYKPGDFESVYEAHGWKLPQDPIKSHIVRLGLFVCVNLPSALLLAAPFALLAWGPAHILWMALMSIVMTFAAYLMWKQAESYASGVALFLVCVLLANLEMLYALGNIAGIAVSLAVVAVWCFINERFVVAGVASMAMALAMKPHDVVLIWLYFVLAGGVYRRRALQVLLITAALTLPAMLWVSHVAPQWQTELHANLAAGEVRGQLNDPGPTSFSFHYADFVVSLQSLLSVFRDDRGFYNPGSYLICGVMLLMGAFRALRSRFTRANAWFAVAAIAPLSVLPIYHRMHDAKLLLLTIPACAMLWSEGGKMRRVALALNIAAILSTADIVSTLLTMPFAHLNAAPAEMLGKLLIVFVVRPAPLCLLALSVLYLWVFWKRATALAESPAPSKLQAAPVGEAV